MHWIDPDYLPETSGTLKQFLINPHGEIDGMIFQNGTEVHFPPHMARQIGKSIGIGDEVKVRGVRPRGSDVIAGVSVETSKAKRIVDEGPPEKKRKPSGNVGKLATTDVDGKVQRPLHGPKGEIRGVLLQTGEAVRFPPHESGLSPLTKPGAKFAARGRALTTKFGTVVVAEQMGPTANTLRKIRPKKPKH